MPKQINGSVRMGYVQAVLDYLAAHHPDGIACLPTQLLVGLNPQSLNDRISISHWGELLTHAIAACNDPDLPLKIAEALTPRHWGVFAYAAMSCATLADVAALLERYERLIDEVNDTLLQIDNDAAVLTWIPRSETVMPAFMQLSLASWCVFARRYSDQMDLVADADFTFPPPADTARYEHLFGGRVRFSQAATRLRFSLHYLRLPITHHDAEIHRMLLSQAQIQLEALTPDPDIVQQLRQGIFQQLSSGRATLEHLAATFGMSPRRLQYQLEEHGLSFREVLDDVRLKLAREYLQDLNMSIIDVAFLLGYSEQSPFQKAFKRWTGQTPGEFRKQIG